MDIPELEEYGDAYRCAECWERFRDVETFDLHLRIDMMLNPPCRCLTIREMQDLGLIQGRGGFWYFPALRRWE